MSETIRPDGSDCPNAAEHTPQPAGYLAWHYWAGRMYRAGHRQRRCPGCGLLAIWVGPGLPSGRKSA